MSDTAKVKTGKFKTQDVDIDDLRDVEEFNRMRELERDRSGHVEYDELGNPVWVPYRSLSGKETLALLLNDQSLALTEDEPAGGVRRIQQNPGGLTKGYDPYDSGMLLKKRWKKKKDLRALSHWIQQKKRVQDT